LEDNGTARELQDIALYGFMKDEYIMGKCADSVQESYFDTETHKIIFRCLKHFYNKYHILPGEKELSSMIINECVDKNKEYTNGIVVCMSKIYNTEMKSQDYLYEQVIRFIRRNKIERSLRDVVNYQTNTGKIDLDKVAGNLSEDLSLTLGKKQEAYNLGDISVVEDIISETVGDINNPMMIKFFIDAVNKRMQFKALSPGTLNMVSAPPGTGKTTLMINQGMFAAREGYEVLHIFLGDMSRYDAIIRYLSNKSGIASNRLVEMSVNELKNTIKNNNLDGALGRINVVSYAQCELNATQLIEEIKRLQKDNKHHYDMIIIDYDENISKDDEDNIYESGGLIYNKMGMFAVENHSVVFIVSQPKPGYWNQEIIPLEAAAESSKKQKIIDTMITMGKPFRSSSVGSLFIAKNRRGEVGSIIRIKMNGANTRIEAITQREYDEIKSREEAEQNNGSQYDD